MINHPADDLSAIYNITQQTHSIITIKTAFEKGVEVGYPSISLLLVGPFAHSDNALCYLQKQYNLNTYWIGTGNKSLVLQYL